MKTLNSYFNILATIFLFVGFIYVLRYIMKLLLEILFLKEKVKDFDEQEAKRKEYYAPKIDRNGVWTMQLYNN